MNLLEEARVPDSRKQKGVYDRIDEYSRSGEFYEGLATVLQLGKGEASGGIRHMAGLEFLSHLFKDGESNICPHLPLSLFSSSLKKQNHNNEPPPINQSG